MKKKPTGTSRINARREKAADKAIGESVEAWIGIAVESAKAKLRERLREVDPDFYVGLAPEHAEMHVAALAGGIKDTVARVLKRVAVEAEEKALKTFEAEGEFKAASPLSGFIFDLPAFAAEAVEEVIAGYLQASLKGTPSAIYGLTYIGVDDGEALQVVNGLDDERFAFALRMRVAAWLPSFAVVGFSQTPRASAPLTNKALDALAAEGFRVYSQRFAVTPASPDPIDRAAGVEVIAFGSAVAVVPPFGSGEAGRPPSTAEDFAAALGLSFAVVEGYLKISKLAPVEVPIFIEDARTCFLAYLAGIPATLSVEEAGALILALPPGSFEDVSKEADKVFAAMRAAGRIHGLFRDPNPLAAKGGILEEVFGRKGGRSASQANGGAAR